MRSGVKSRMTAGGAEVLGWTPERHVGSDQEQEVIKLQAFEH